MTCGSNACDEGTERGCRVGRDCFCSTSCFSFCAFCLPRNNMLELVKLTSNKWNAQGIGDIRFSSIKVAAANNRAKEISLQSLQRGVTFSQGVRLLGLLVVASQIENIHKIRKEKRQVLVLLPKTIVTRCVTVLSAFYNFF